MVKERDREEKRERGGKDGDRTELRSALNFENVFETLTYLIIPEPIL